jgi:hypothetical protein
MGLFASIKKTAAKEQSPAQGGTLSAGFEVTTWNDFNEGIFSFLKESGVFDEITSADKRIYFTAQLVPEPDNVHDKHAIKVLAKAKGKKVAYQIGYVPAPKNVEIGALIPRAAAENYYWSGTTYYSFITGCSFTVNLKKSKF